MTINTFSLSSRAVIVFAKYPEPGLVKTRIASSMGKGFAFELYVAMLRDLIGKLICEDSIDCHFFVYPPSGTGAFADMFVLDKKKVHPQMGEDLGERMYLSFVDRFRNGAEAAVCIGTDIPGLTLGHIDKALDALSENGAVLGPSIDGGYYLIGFRKADITDRVFREMIWSTRDVFMETIYRLGTMGISFEVLGSLRDMDDISDFEFYRTNKNFYPEIGPRLYELLRIARTGYKDQ